MTEHNDNRRVRAVMSWITPILAVLAIVFAAQLVLGLFLSNDVVTGDSMQQTLQNGDRLVSVKNREIARNDIVVMNSPTEKNRLYIKRVIGLPGDTVQVKNERLYINDKLVKQPYLNQRFMAQQVAAYEETQKKVGQAGKFTDDFTLQTLKATHRATVPKGQYFVLGDNRRVSYDSRYFGFVPKEKIQSVVVWRYWPINKMTNF